MKMIVVLSEFIRGGHLLDKSKKEQRRITIKNAAKELFVDKNIVQTTFHEIAKKAGVGEATIYRHFTNKEELVQEIAIDYLNQVNNELKEIFEQGVKQSQLERLESVMDYYIGLFENRPDYYIFLEHFDNFIAHCNKRPDRFHEYEVLLDDILELHFYGETNTSSMTLLKDMDLAIRTFAKNFNSHCQKLLLRGKIISADYGHEPMEELKLLKELYKRYLNNNEGRL